MIVKIRWHREYLAVSEDTISVPDDFTPQQVDEAVRMFKNAPEHEGPSHDQATWTGVGYLEWEHEPYYEGRIDE